MNIYEITFRDSEDDWSEDVCLTEHGKNILEILVRLKQVWKIEEIIEIKQVY